MQKSDYRAFNAVFGKVACVASVLKIKRQPVSLYGLKACPLTKTQLSRIISVTNEDYIASNLVCGQTMAIRWLVLRNIHQNQQVIISPETLSWWQVW